MALGTSTPYHLDPKATYFVLCCVATLALCLLISIWHGDFSAIVAVLGLVSIQIGSQDLLFLFGVLAPASMFIDVFWMVGRPNNYLRGHGWLIFFTVCDMLAKATGAVLAWSLYNASSGEPQYSMAGTSSAHQGSGFVPPQAPQNYQSPASQADPFASYAPPRPEPQSAAAPPDGAYQSFPTSQAPTHVL